MPPSWKLSIIIPIYKKGEKTNPENYRPISLTSICCKVMEGIIKDSIVSFFSNSPFLFHHQSAFLPGKSTNSQLLQFTDLLTSHVSKDQQVDSAYIDFAKAFDSVSHPKLLHKLKFLGIGGPLLKWVECFLTDRRQCVKVGNSLSFWSPVLSGIPQGSVIGPLLFLAYINDLRFVSSCPMFIFADDAKCVTTIKTLEDCVLFQKVLDCIFDWSNTWQLPLSINNCNVISFYLNSEPIIFTYQMGGQPILRVEKVSDLGIDYCSNLSFTTHIHKIRLSARIRSAQILRCFSSRDAHLMYLAFKTYVRPLLEYNSNVWSPYKLGDIRKLESIQRRFTKNLKGMKNLSYIDRLKALKSSTLESRRILADLVMYYKIMHGMVDLPRDLIFTLKPAQRSTRGHSLTLAKPKIVNNIDRYTFKNRHVNLWNILPDQIVNSPSLNAFKMKVKQLDIINLTSKANACIT